MNQYKGLLHVHSTSSHDGRHPLSEIAELGLRLGYRFVCMTEHAESLTPASYRRYIAECRHVSTAQCVIIPGLELECKGGLHIMGFGLVSWIRNDTAPRVVSSIRESGGIAVIAHPDRYNYQVSLDLADLVHGIEVWNQGYDGRFFPNHRSLKLLRLFRGQNPRVLAFGGLDLHRITPVSHLRTVVIAQDGSEGSILYALRNGDFTVGNLCLRLGSAGNRLNLKWLPLLAARGAYSFAREIRRRLRPSLQS